ncbi:MAG: 3-hydroxyacyl-CoA dehydrogenase family protein [Deltaproteobacteria bacterium]|nr:3-hydroxyacyl-CoA dehydrogenase family protein [Deltaproteobacteria bacterium]
MNEIRRVAVIGTGVIGAAWVTLFAIKGYDVAAYSRTRSTREKGLENVHSNLGFFVKKHMISEVERESALRRVTIVDDLEEAVRDADFIEECTGETYDVKKSIFSEIGKYAPSHAIIASSTSGLSMSEIQQVVKQKDKCIITHPWNPPHLIPLIEIVPGKDTSQETTDTAYSFMERLGKVPVIVRKEVTGFIGNRLAAALWREAIDLVDRGVATVEDVDKAIHAGPGIRWALMGTHMTYHLGGGEAGGYSHFIEGIGNTTFKTIWEELETRNHISDPVKEKLNQGVKEAIKGKSFQDIVQWRDDKIVDILSIKEDQFWGDPMNFPVYDVDNITQKSGKEVQKKPAEVRKIKERVA